ncbi:cyclic pyranopterin phosphate synthase [Thermovibrio guaymasensis]|uniref:GTP 3',8-cyclase n=1 Tax=Thermovibrio guaymasensis TaxID=240167 RepID=A0A420W976_9BACT|nr:GTP 3',8-cyclase MoaA [Thermovibrio guaymasensis]RKQ63808.1 cyclic pyranopterin phosphate synthase [Thermovibrio guaymasensis]
MKNISYLRVSVTDRCNFRCKYCMPEGVKEFIPHPEILRYEEISLIVKAFSKLGVDSVRLTGGEPLVRKGIESFISDLSQIDGISDISLTTNGYFLSEKASLLKEAGLKRVNVSIDTLDPEKFSFITGSSKSSLFRVIDGVLAAIEANLNPVKVNTVLIKGFNDSEIEEFVKFSDEFQVEVRFIELMPVGGKFFSQENFIPISEIREKIEAIYGPLEPYKNYKKGPAKSFKVSGTKAVIGFIPSISEHFCHECNRVRLTSDGKLRLCLMSDKEINLKEIIRSPDFSFDKLLNTLKGALLLKCKVNGIEALESLGCSRKMFTIGG